MNFGEGNQEKILISVDFSGRDPDIKEIPIPLFRKLVSIRGDFEKFPIL